MTHTARHLAAFLRVTDSTGKLSLTNLLCMLALYKVFQAPVLDAGTVSVLIAAFSTYTGKKLLGGSDATNPSKVSEHACGTKRDTKSVGPTCDCAKKDYVPTLR